MKLAKALKEKNRLVGIINRLKLIIVRENSRDVTSTSKIDVNALYQELIEATDKLIAIKSEIFKSNVGIYDKIVRMGELKSRIAWIQGLPTTDGIIEDNYSSRPSRKEIKAAINIEKVDLTVVELQKEIEQLQDFIDEYNSTVDIKI